jgi:AAHS family 3-hydroxyphenylpropionic acid transporter
MAAEAVVPTVNRSTQTVGLCFLAALAEGFDVQSMGVAAPRLGPALGLTRDQLGPVFSASVVGLLIGAVLVGRLADRLGRKWSLILSLAVLSAFSFATVWAWDLDSLLVIRLLAGLGLGGAMPNLVTLSAEAVDPRDRERTVAWATAGMPFGGAVAAAVAAGLGWKEIFLVGGAAPLALAALMAVALPESARFQAARASTPARPAGYLAILFGGGRAMATLLMWTASFAALLTLYLMLNWLPTLMGAKGVSKPNASLVSMLFNIGGGSGVLALAGLLHRGRRGVVMGAWFAATAVSLGVLAIVGPDLAAAGAAGFAAGVFVSSSPLMLYALAPGYYAVVMRGSGVGAMVAVGRIGAILGPLLAAALLSGGAGPDAVLLALIPLVVLAAIATLLLLRSPATAD